MISLWTPYIKTHQTKNNMQKQTKATERRAKRKGNIKYAYTDRCTE